MAFYAGQVPTAAELDAIGGRLVKGYESIVTKNAIGASTITIWTVNWTPESTGTYRIDTSTPYDGISPDEAKFWLLVDGTARRFRTRKMPANQYVDFVEISYVLEVTSVAAMTIGVSAFRTSGTNTFNSRLEPRTLDIYKVGPTGLITA